jgi:S-adenosylmethionine decarboxylase
MVDFVGTHAIFDLLFEVNDPILTDHITFVNLMRDVVLGQGATVLREDVHGFEGDGYTFTLILAESHASGHTWPEYGMATFDIYMCGKCDAHMAMDFFIDKINAEHNLKRRDETRIFRGWVGG